MAKDTHGKPEGISNSKSGSTIIPSFPSRHMNPSDLGYHSSHLHSSRFSGKTFCYQCLRAGRAGRGGGGGGGVWRVLPPKKQLSVNLGVISEKQMSTNERLVQEGIPYCKEFLVNVVKTECDKARLLLHHFAPRWRNSSPVMSGENSLQSLSHSVTVLTPKCSFSAFWISKLWVSNLAKI